MTKETDSRRAELHKALFIRLHDAVLARSPDNRDVKTKTQILVAACRAIEADVASAEIDLRLVAEDQGNPIAASSSVATEPVDPFKNAENLLEKATGYYSTKL